MSLMAIIAAGQQGLLTATIGGAIGAEEPVARAAVERLLEPLARRLSAHADDPVESEVILNVIAGGGYQRYLDDPRALLSRAAIRDGEEMLSYLYGSVEAAREDARTIGPPAGLDAEVFTRLMTVVACLLLGALARRLEQRSQDRLADVGTMGQLKGLGEAILRGFMDGTARSMFRRRASFRHRMARRRRRRPDPMPSPRPSLDELLGDDLNGSDRD